MIVPFYFQKFILLLILRKSFIQTHSHKNKSVKRKTNKLKTFFSEHFLATIFIAYSLQW